MTLRAAYRTQSGRMLDLAAPDPDLIDLEDLAHHLARVCRFGGAVDGFYSVASHSTYVAARLRDQYGAKSGIAAAGLLHDAAEAYLGDMTSGLKQLFPEYRELERRWSYAIERKFSVVFVGSRLIKEADLRARLAEARDLFGGGYPRELLVGEGIEQHQPYAERCVCQTPDEAEWAFMSMARELGLFR